jgi:hypothetical protein
MRDNGPDDQDVSIVYCAKDQYGLRHCLNERWIEPEEDVQQEEK